MEATEGSGCLLNKILPPRLEDAGLEDCALPPDAIHKAFLKAATAVKSRFDDFLDKDIDGECVSDPWPSTEGKETDIIVGASPPDVGSLDTVLGGATPDPPGPCVAGKSGENQEDHVLIGGDIGKEKEREGGCGDVSGGGLDGLDADKKQRKKEEDNGGKPTLVEGVV